MDLKKEIKLSSLVPKRKASAKPKADKVSKAKAKSGKRRASGSKSRELVGLKVGASQIAAARIVNNGSNELVQVVREPLAPGIVVGGEVRDPAALGEALAGLFSRHELPRKGVRLGLANSRIGVRVIEKAVLDWRELSRDVDEMGSVTRRILLVVVYRESVDRYLAATDHAGIELEGIDLEAFALLRAVSEPAPEDAERPEAAIVAITVGHERTTLAISDGRVCEFTRVLEWGGAEVTAAIARAVKISPLEAEELKHQLSFHEDIASDLARDPRYEQAVEAARFELQTLVR